jgi:hypothetical protein
LNYLVEQEDLLLLRATDFSLNASRRSERVVVNLNRVLPRWALTRREMALREVVWFLNGAVSLPDCESSRSEV